MTTVDWVFGARDAAEALAAIAKHYDDIDRAEQRRTARRLIVKAHRAAVERANRTVRNAAGSRTRADSPGSPGSTAAADVHSVHRPGRHRAPSFDEPDAPTVPVPRQPPPSVWFRGRVPGTFRPLGSVRSPFPTAACEPLRPVRIVPDLPGPTQWGSIYVDGHRSPCPATVLDFRRPPDVPAIGRVPKHAVADAALDAELRRKWSTWLPREDVDDGGRSVEPARDRAREPIRDRSGDRFRDQFPDPVGDQVREQIRDQAREYERPRPGRPDPAVHDREWTRPDRSTSRSTAPSMPSMASTATPSPASAPCSTPPSASLSPSSRRGRWRRFVDFFTRRRPAPSTP